MSTKEFSFERLKFPLSEIFNQIRRILKSEEVFYYIMVFILAQIAPEIEWNLHSNYQDSFVTTKIYFETK